MDNNIRKLEKDLRSFAKRNQNVTYTKGLLMTFLITGMVSLSTWGAISPSDYTNYRTGYTVAVDSKQNRLNSELNEALLGAVYANLSNGKAGASVRQTENVITGQASKMGNVIIAQSGSGTAVTTQEIEGLKKNIDTSVSEMHKDFKTFKKENDRLLKASRLELIQLMEQGDHVVKSPWSSWQYGINYYYNNWNGEYKGRGDKSKEYETEGVFQRGNWWTNNVAPTSSTYERVAVDSNPRSTSTKTRKDLGIDYGLVKTREVPDLGVPFLIEPKITINTPPLPNLNINPVVVTPGIAFNIPDIETVNFKPIDIKPIKPNVFNPPALNEVSTGFGQGREVGYNTAQNYILSNSSVEIDSAGAEFTIRDTSYTRAGGLSWDGGNDRYNSATLVPVTQVPNLANTEFRSMIDARDPNGGQEFQSIKGSVVGTATYSGNDYSVYTRDIPVSENIYKETPNTGVDYRYLTRPDMKLPQNVISGTPGVHAFNSQQTIINMLTDDVTVDGGKITLKNATVTPRAYGNAAAKTSYTNTLRAVSVNHAYGALNKTTEFKLKSDLDLYGRDGINDKIASSGDNGANGYGNTPHMTIGIEHQAYGSLGARAVNEGTMTLKAVDAKTGTGTATNLIGMTAMIEDYNDFRAIPIGATGTGTANANIDNTWFYGDGTTGSMAPAGTGIGTPTPTSNALWTHRRQAPWESTMENRGKIVVEAVNSIGIDFGQYSYAADLRNFRPFAAVPALSTNAHLPETMYPTGSAAYGNKGSLNIYVKVGNVQLTGEGTGVTGSYGLRVPNLFAEFSNGRQRAELYFDETVIDGSVGAGSKGIEVKGEHNVGVSISKLITSGKPGQTDTLVNSSANSRVRQYQAGELSGNIPADGAKPYLTARDREDPIGNIYRLNIEVDGTENIGLLRKSDYMNGVQARIGGDGKIRAKKDFVITDGHVQNIDFTGNAKGGVLFRTDKHGIDLAKTNFEVTPMATRQTYTNGDDIFNIVMLSNGTEHGVNTGKWYNLGGTWRDTEGYASNDGGGALTILQTPVKVSNSTPITLGDTAATGYNLIGLMAYKGGQAVSNADITVNSNNSIGMVIDGAAVDHTHASAQISGNPRNGQPKLADADSKGIVDGSKITVAGEGSTGVYNSGRSFTVQNNGLIDVTGKGSVGIYASGAIKDTSETGASGGQTPTYGTTIVENSKVNASGEGSIALYAKDGAVITLKNSDMEIEDGALLFFTNKSTSTAPVHPQSHLTVDASGGDTVATIKNGGTAFYFKQSEGLTLADAVQGTDNLDLVLETGSILNLIEGDGMTPTNLSSITVLPPITGSDFLIPGTKINIKGTSGAFTNTRASKYSLIIDTDVDLDNVGDTYLNSDFVSSSITVNAGNKITGSGALTTAQTTQEKVDKSKVAIAQINSGTSRSDVKLVNNGLIELTGSGMTGIVGEFAEIANNSDLKVTGDNGTAIISSNDALARNSSTGNIEIGNGGIGIAGINYLGTTSPAAGSKAINLVNDGTIKSVGTVSGAIGILATDDEAVSGSSVNSITLGAGSVIDVSSAPQGIGVYSRVSNSSGAVTKSATITDNGSDIIIGADGAGIYSDGVVITAAGGKIESRNGATGKGIYTNKDVTASKNITLPGDKSIGIHIYGTDSVNVVNSGVITLGDSLNQNDPSIGIYSPNAGTVSHSGVINAGNRSLGIYSITGDVASSGSIAAGDEGIGVYKKGGTLTLGGAVTSGNGSVGIVGDNGSAVINNAAVSIGDNSFGFVMLDNGANSYTGTSAANFSMGSKSVYLYKKGASGAVNTALNISASGNSSTGLYAADNGVINNTGTISFENNTGNVGAYAINGGTVNNGGKIITGISDITPMNPADRKYAIGMAAQYGGRVVNQHGGTITVSGNYGIGMFADGPGSRAENYGTIDLSSAGELKGAYGMYLDNGAYGLNSGTIKSGRYSNDPDKEAAYGVVVMNGATFENTGTIDIDVNSSYGLYINGGIIKNYGAINISGTNSIGIRNKDGKDEHGNPITAASMNAANVTASNGAAANLDDSSSLPKTAAAGSTVISPSGVATINGEVVPIHDMTPGPSPLTGNFAFSNVGIYIDTLGRTNPINWVDGFNPYIDNDLIIGAEAAEITSAKAIKIGTEMISPYIPTYYSLGGGRGGQKLNAISGALTWTAQPIEGPSGYPEEVILAKIPYTDFVDETENAWNFADGLEQRYGVEGVGTREKVLFNKLNSIGKNEQVLLTQAYDEMMGHQYANTQQRIHSTGRALDKEFTYLRNEWDTKSKQSNKVKVFGMNDEYRTDTAGIINYKSNAYGAAYFHEDETVKLGNASGWYAGLIQNRFRFKDIGKSTENQTMIKAGIFKTMSPSEDHNGSLRWTVSGEGFASQNDMHRKFLVVDDIFNAKSKYHSYGAAIKNEIVKDFRTTERTSIAPYASLKLEYGKVSSIHEKAGEIRLDIKDNDYFSVRPELGINFNYRQPVAVRSTFTATLGLGYENELGRVTDTDNKGRVAFTNADWFGIRGEKDDRKGNFKADLNLGLENQRVGITVNAGYDTKGENVRGGIGLRAIY